MSIFQSLRKGLPFLNFKTLHFNLKYFPFRVACRLPVLVHNKVCLKELSGRVILPEKAGLGTIIMGVGDVGIFDKKISRCIWQVAGVVTFDGKAHFGHGSKICVGMNGHLTIGKNFMITAETQLICWKSITFGQGCLVSWDCLFMDTDFHSITDISGEKLNEDKPILIGDNVWIGCRCTILKGTKIPNSSVIAANSTIIGAFSEENSVYTTGGKILKRNIRWKV